MEAIYDTLIVGAGTAGMTAAIYGQRAGKRTLLIEAGIYGGQIINTPEIENYPGIRKISGYQFASALYEQAEAFGARLETGAVTALAPAQADGRLWTVRTEQAAYTGRSVILATGAKHRKLGLEREELLTGRGISYCAACDGAFYRGRTAAVIGGGNTALGDAEYLANLCEQVYLIHRRETFRGAEALVQRIKQRENVTVQMNTRAIGLLGDTRLEGLRLEDVRTGESRELAVDGVFIAIGQEPDNGAFVPLVELDAQGYIRAGEDCRTRTPGIFAAGDCRTKQVRQLTTAAADGAAAALAAIAYLDERNDEKG